jgi:hypothetical protein
MFPVLALLSRSCHQENHTRPDKSGILQRMRNMHAGMPGKGYNHGVTKRSCQKQEKSVIL